MELPFTARLPSNFGPNSQLEIEAKPKHADCWFSITLLEDNQVLTDKYDECKHLAIFQLQLRYDEGIIVMNSIKSGQAEGDEIREHLHIDKGEKVKVTIKVTNNKYKVLLNGEVVGRFNHRFHPEEAKYVNVYGDFAVKKMVHHKE